MPDIWISFKKIFLSFAVYFLTWVATQEPFTTITVGSVAVGALNWVKHFWKENKA